MAGSADVARLVLAAVFAAAGLAKLVYGRRLAETLTLGGLVPLPLVQPLRWLLPPAELGTAALLVLNPVPPLAGLVAVALLAVFSASAWKAVRSGASLPCACFGGGNGTTLDHGTIARNATLAGYAVWAAASSRTPLGGPHHGRVTPLAIDAVALALIPFVLGRAVSLWTKARGLADKDVVANLRATPRGAT